jgi:hypothetical protein
MAGMLVPSLGLLPGVIWEVAFAATAGWFASRAIRARRRHGARAPPPGHYLPHLMESGDTLYMLAAGSAPGPSCSRCSCSGTWSGPSTGSPPCARPRPARPSPVPPRPAAGGLLPGRGLHHHGVHADHDAVRAGSGGGVQPEEPYWIRTCSACTLAQAAVPTVRAQSVTVAGVELQVGSLFLSCVRAVSWRGSARAARTSPAATAAQIQNPVVVKTRSAGMPCGRRGWSGSRRGRLSRDCRRWCGRWR